MTKKIIYFAIALVMSACVILCRIFFPACMFSQWGNYFLIIPVIYCFSMFFSKKNSKAPLMLIYVFAGITLSLLLNRHWEDSYVFLKFFASFLGLGVTYLIHKANAFSNDQ
jgi:hypothetical protein